MADRFAPLAPLTTGRAEPMERLLFILSATAWFGLISSLWFGAVSLSALILLQQQFAFDPLLAASWQALTAGFQRGQAIPLSFILICLALLTLGLIGEAAILWRLPIILARLPALALPSFALPRLALRLAKLRRPGLGKPRAQAPAAPVQRAVPTAVPPPPEPVAAAASQSADSATLARILALFELWNEPPPSWMAAALRDEIDLLSPDAWPTLETLGSHGLDLLLTLQAHGMLPESQASLDAIGKVGTALRAGLAAETGLPEVASPLPPLTLAASWLCEALENFLAAQQDQRSPSEPLAMAQSMLEAAMRGMRDDDWASLDLFPEKASRVRVLTDRLREDMRKTGPAKPAPPPITPIEAIMALLDRFGFSLEQRGPGSAGAPFVAQRPDLILFLHLVDLRQKSWSLPQGPLGPWQSEEDAMSPGRQLWQLLARRRLLRRADGRPLAGLLILKDGRIEEEGRLADLVLAERRRSAIGLAWLEAADASQPTLERALNDLTEQAARERAAVRCADNHAALPP
jgi:hypothetical protein